MSPRLHTVSLSTYLVWQFFCCFFAGSSDIVYYWHINCLCMCVPHLFMCVGTTPLLGSVVWQCTRVWVHSGTLLYVEWQTQCGHSWDMSQISESSWPSGNHKFNSESAKGKRAKAPPPFYKRSTSACCVHMQASGVSAFVVLHVDI